MDDGHKGAVAPTATRFARYLRRKHKIYPKDLWQTQIVTLVCVPGINFPVKAPK